MFVREGAQARPGALEETHHDHVVIGRRRIRPDLINESEAREIRGAEELDFDRRRT
jgi:hypothetical protein